MCRFHQTSSESLFMKQRICTLPTPSGRISLLGNELSVQDHGQEHTLKLASDEQISAQLQKHFGFPLPVTNKS
jgi:N-hydroxyarylamine O-acetyltransferase